MASGSSLGVGRRGRPRRRCGRSRESRAGVRTVGGCPPAPDARVVDGHRPPPARSLRTALPIYEPGSPQRYGRCALAHVRSRLTPGVPGARPAARLAAPPTAPVAHRHGSRALEAPGRRLRRRHARAGRRCTMSPAPTGSLHPVLRGRAPAVRRRRGHRLADQLRPAGQLRPHRAAERRAARRVRLLQPAGRAGRRRPRASARTSPPASAARPAAAGRGRWPGAPARASDPAVGHGQFVRAQETLSPMPSDDAPSSRRRARRGCRRSCAPRPRRRPAGRWAT